MTTIETEISGLSPRGRGNRRIGGRQDGSVGSIPAWAGKPRSALCRSCRPPVYPRVGGETWAPSSIHRRCRGLSPRGRGNQRQPDGTYKRLRSIPAWAGKPVSTRWTCRVFEVYPRVGGETSGTTAPTSRPMGLSPRGRGNHHLEIRVMASFGSIPAWAGKPPRRSPAWPRSRVYPRVGGETQRRLPPLPDRRGLSPRGRGNPALLARQPPGVGSIPAWAGKPSTWRYSSLVRRVYPRVGGETCSSACSAMIR